MACEESGAKFRHAQHMLKNVRQWMEDNPDHLDVLIKLKDGLILSHSLLLAVVSPFLSELLKGLSEPMIVVPNLPSADLQIFFQSIFNNTVHEEDIPTLKRVCRFLRVPTEFLPQPLLSPGPKSDDDQPKKLFVQHRTLRHGDTVIVDPKGSVTKSEPGSSDETIPEAQDMEPRAASPFFSIEDLQTWMNDTRHNTNQVMDDPYEESLSSTPPPFSQDFDALPFLSADPGLKDKKGLRKCHFCSNSYRYIRGRNIHMLSKHRQECQEAGILFDCDFCADHFITNSGRDRHLDSIHGLKVNDIRATKSIDIAKRDNAWLPVGCLSCNKRFGDCQALRIHVKNHHPGNLLCCLMCGQPHMSKEALFNHIQVHVNDPKNIFFVCKHCQTNFTVKYELRTHIRRQHKPEPTHHCMHCGQGFFTLKFLDNHIAREHFPDTKKVFACTQCDKRFQFKALLARHVRSHFGIRPHQCGICSKKFASASNLNAHQKRHAIAMDGVVYGCNVCSLSFEDPPQLEIHLASQIHKDKEVNQRVADIIRGVKLTVSA